MRELCRIPLIILWSVLLCPLSSDLPPAQASAPGGQRANAPAQQALFLGDRVCTDDAQSCRFPGVNAAHRYLHVILHDLPGNDDWQVQAAGACSFQNMPTLGEGKPIDASGFLELVLDLSAAPGGQHLFMSQGCYVFRGRNHWAVTFYAAYFDDVSQPDAEQVYPGYEELSGRPDLPDLDVTYIHRDPSYAYDASRSAPLTGERVNFVAHVINAGWRPAPGFSYRWLVGSRLDLAGRSEQTLLPGQEANFSIPWRWTIRPQMLTFQILPGSEEITSANDQLTIRTDALSLGFWVERSAYTYFHERQWLYCQGYPQESPRRCSGSNSFEDWLQRQVLAWNQLLGRAVYPAVAPVGVADRVRVDKLTIVPDGALPLHGDRATNTPDVWDHTVDLQWGLPAQGVARTYPHNWEGPFDVDWDMIHELNHARYLADLYRFDVPFRDAGAVTVVGANGKPAWDPARPSDPSNKLVPFVSNRDEMFLYQNREQDLMSCSCTPSYSAYTVTALNRLRERRPRCGNFNPPCNMGEWFAEVPPVNELRLFDPSGHRIPEATVKLYLDTGTSYTGHGFDQSHSLTLRASAGDFRFPSDPFGAHGSSALAAHNLLLVEVRAGSDDEFCFLEPSSFNMAYWFGYRDAAHPALYLLRLGRQSDNGCNLQLPPRLINEPYATSPYASHIWLGAIEQSGKGQMRRLTVQLLDDAKPPHGMSHRQIEVSAASGTVVARGTTGTGGLVRLSVPPDVAAVRVRDLSDNNLLITSPVEAGSGPAAPRR